MNNHDMLVICACKNERMLSRVWLDACWVTSSYSHINPERTWKTSISFAIFSKILLGIHGMPSYLLSAGTTLVVFVAYADYGKNPFSFIGFMQSSYLSSAGTTLWSWLWHVQIMEKNQSHSLVLCKSLFGASINHDLYDHLVGSINSHHP